MVYCIKMYVVNQVAGIIVIDDVRALKTIDKKRPLAVKGPIVRLTIAVT